MPALKKRSYKKELLDNEHVPFHHIRRNMQELDLINRRLGGHQITREGVMSLIKDVPDLCYPLDIVEIGCGGGDNLRAIREWARSQKLPVKLTGIDINAACIAYAREQESNAGIHFIHSDYRKAVLTRKPDILFSSLFCHHFTDEELMEQLKWMAQNSRIGFFINDLHRHPIAYYAIKLLTAAFSRSYLVKNDAPLSVQRGFKRTDWEHLLRNTGLRNGKCRWRWAFRWLVTYAAHDTAPGI